MRRPDLVTLEEEEDFRADLLTFSSIWYASYKASTDA